VPLPQVGQSIAYCHVPDPLPPIEPAVVEANATAGLFVKEVKSVSVGMPARSHASVFIERAPVLAKVSPAVSVTTTWTSGVGAAPRAHQLS